MITLDMNLNTQADFALEYFKKNDVFKAKEICQSNLSKNPKHPSSLNLLGIILFKEGNTKEAIEALKNAILYSNDKSKDYSFNLAKIYHVLKQYELAANTYRNCGYYGQAADLFFIQKKITEAKECLHESLQTTPLDAVCLNKLGVIYSIEENYIEAKNIFLKSIEIDNQNPQTYNNLGAALHKLKEYHSSKNAFEKAILLNPQYVEAFNHLGMLLNDLELNEEAIQAYQTALKINPHFEDAHFNLGHLYFKQQNLETAIFHFQNAIKEKPEYFEAFLEIGKCYRNLNEDVNSIYYLQQAEKIKSNSIEVKSYLLRAYQNICDWSNFSKTKDLIEQSCIDNTFEEPLKAVSRSMDLAYLLKMAKQSANEIKESVKNFKKEYKFILKKDKKKIHIGYLSSDFHNHATAHLFTGVLELHNKYEFEVFIYSYGKNDASHYRNRIINSTTNFKDVSSLKNEEIADQIYNDNIDILIDLKGYTNGARLQICALKPAPIQITYLGFPGTLGADFFDYFIVDKVIVPKEHLPYYTETPIYMPHTYQPNDNKQPISPRNFSKSECNLPEDHFIFCSFNQSYKFEPVMFDCWMNILKKVPKSSLWLLKSSEAVMENLKKEATFRGVNSSRLIFAEQMTKDLHLSRLKNADLMLDTRIYNGHTTTSDALFVNVPVITVEGDHFASRVSSSLLQAINLNDLICKTQEEFETLAIKMAQSKEFYSEIKNKLRENKFSCPLYDTKQFTLDLEDRYKRAYTNYIDGKKLDPIE